MCYNKQKLKFRLFTNPSYFITAFLLVFYLQASIISASAQQIKIMPLGDSITQGFSSGVANEEFQVSYRKALYDKLKLAGYVVNDEIFVGTLFSGESVPDFDPDHEGHPGWRADEIFAGRPGSGEGKLSDWLFAEEPDIVLLHIGTNDISGNNEDWHEVEDILIVIDDYEFTSGKTVWVILALIIDRSCDPFLPPCSKSAETTSFNNDVEDFVFFPRQAGGDRIFLVDMQNDAGIDYDRWYMGGDMWDTLHPFETGYAKMADVWFPAIEQVLNICTLDADLVIDNQTFSTTEAFEACETVTAGPTVNVTATGDVNFQAGERVVLRNGFSVEDGGRLTVITDPLTGH